MTTCTYCGRDTEAKDGVCWSCRGGHRSVGTPRGERRLRNLQVLGGSPVDDDDDERDWTSSQRYHGSNRDDI